MNTNALLLGRTVQELGTATLPSAWGTLGNIWTLTTPNFTLSSAILCDGQISAGSGTWFAANCPLAMPFVLDEPQTVYQLGWLNGSAAGGNADLGIYDTSWNRLVSTGSTGGSGNSTFQFVDVADTVIGPGSYWLVYCRDDVTANRIQIYNSGPLLGLMRLTGCYDSATTAFALPATLTNMALAATATNPPYVLVATRTVV